MVFKIITKQNFISSRYEIKRSRERVLYFENFIVIEPGLNKLKKNQLLGEEELIKYQDEYGEEAFTAGIGAEAILEILKSINLEEERETIN